MSIKELAKAFIILGVIVSGLSFGISVVGDHVFQEDFLLSYGPVTLTDGTPATAIMYKNRKFFVDDGDYEIYILRAYPDGLEYKDVFATAYSYEFAYRQYLSDLQWVKGNELHV